MMDVWLAMFSDPNRVVFSPEINFVYKNCQGSILRGSIFSASMDLKSAVIAGQQAEMQVWLTNLISSTTGMRTVNIDFGVEAQGHVDELSLAAPLVESGATQFRNMHSHWTANLRLLGKHIQDTSLVAKYGRYEAQDGLSPAGTKAYHRGVVYGGDLQLYFLHWLGIEGHYLSYDGRDSHQQKILTQSYDALAFIDISILRLTGGPYWEHVVMHDVADESNFLDSKGILAGAELHF